MSTHIVATLKRTSENGHTWNETCIFPPDTPVEKVLEWGFERSNKESYINPSGEVLFDDLTVNVTLSIAQGR
jgi:hypothetical protein